MLLVFVLIQVNLAYRVAGQDATMNDMRAQIVNLGDLLNIERKANEDLSAELAGISSLLDDTTRSATTSAQLRAPLQRLICVTMKSAIQAQTESLDAARKIIAERVALEAIDLPLHRQRRSSWNRRSRSPRPRRNVSLARISELETVGAASQAEVAQIPTPSPPSANEELTGILAEKEAQAARDKIAIASLGKSLNNALASRVQSFSASVRNSSAVSARSQRPR